MKQAPPPKVDEERLRALVAAYGANPTRWPEDEREPAKELLAESGEAAGWLAEQARLDAWLDDVPAVAPSAALQRRVAEIPARQASLRDVRVWWPWARVRTFVTLGAAAAFMGVVAGVAVPEHTDEDESAWEDYSTMALGLDFSEEQAP